MKPGADVPASTIFEVEAQTLTTAANAAALTMPGAAVGDAVPTATGEVERPPPPCIDLVDAPIPDAAELALYSIHGYLGRTLRIHRDGAPREHCIVVAWPPGTTNNIGKPVSVARRIDDAWFRMIENSLARIPFSHIEIIYRIVIDNQPKLHGLAAFDRRLPDDGRDGHTIWLNEHLFIDEDHWVRANTGSYFSYHSDQPGIRFDGLPADHELFSPILLHEIGHLVMYNLVNPRHEENATPECARTCGDAETGCGTLAKPAQEANCISPYCRPFGFPGSTENWAELYRFYYQSTTTRQLLSTAGSTCVERLDAVDEWGILDRNAWPFGLPNATEFRRSRWDSCGGRACKDW